ncbi:MAG: type IV pilus assembly protein FimV, partial [Litorivicinus sp.]
MRFVVSLLLAFAGSVNAIELGPIQVVSQPGEPFRAQVSVTDLGGTSLDDLLPGLASQPDFERLGVPRLSVLSNLAFELVPGNGVA